VQKRAHKVKVANKIYFADMIIDARYENENAHIAVIVIDDVQLASMLDVTTRHTENTRDIWPFDV
jgi:hypothetical protein